MPHDDRACYGAALHIACQWVRRHPVLPATLRRGGPEADEWRALLARLPGIRCHLSHTRGRIKPDGSGERGDPLLLLVEDAEDWVTLGQYTAIADAWDRLREAGVLDSLSRTDRAVLQALFMMAMRGEGGPQVIAARGYVQRLIEVEFGVKVSDRTVSNAYGRLAARHLVEVLPGKRGRSRDASTRIELRSHLVRGSGSPSAQALGDLTMSPETIEALHAYRATAYAARVAVAVAVAASRTPRVPSRTAAVVPASAPAPPPPVPSPDLVSGHQRASGRSPSQVLAEVPLCLSEPLVDLP